MTGVHELSVMHGYGTLVFSTSGLQIMVLHGTVQVWPVVGTLCPAEMNTLRFVCPVCKGGGFSLLHTALSAYTSRKVDFVFKYIQQKRNNMRSWQEQRCVCVIRRHMKTGSKGERDQWSVTRWRLPPVKRWLFISLTGVFLWRRHVAYLSKIIS